MNEFEAGSTVGIAQQQPKKQSTWRTHF